MSNSYFKFKQFTVYQDKCAMKVGTDGVLLGSWANLKEVGNVLDVGTGTGLVALMLAQRSMSNVLVDAIDIDEAAILQAKQNVSCSPFTRKIRCCHASLQDYAQNSDGDYDLIVSNPPYFSLSLHSPDKQRTLARHTDSLSLSDLLTYSSDLLSTNGRLSIIYPYQDKEHLIKIATDLGLFVTRLTNVFPTPTSAAKRILIELSKRYEDAEEDNLVIEQSRHVYSEKFSDMIKDFYLKL